MLETLGPARRRVDGWASSPPVCRIVRGATVGCASAHYDHSESLRLSRDQLPPRPEMRQLGRVGTSSASAGTTVKALVGKRLARWCGSPLSAWTEIDSGSHCRSGARAPIRWNGHVSELETGQTVDGVEGLIHVSELAGERVGDPSGSVHAGDVLPARIAAIDGERRGFSPSVRLAERT
jgi:S1 RNA binding domain